MANKYFNLVTGKIDESIYFFERMEENNNPLFVFKIRLYLSAFLSATRSITFAMQYFIKGNSEMEKIYSSIQSDLKKDEDAKYFVEARNDSQKTGYYPIKNAGIISTNKDGKTLFNFEFDKDYWRNKIDVPEGDMLLICRKYLSKLLISSTRFYTNFGEEIDNYYYLSSQKLLNSKIEFPIRIDGEIIEELEVVEFSGNKIEQVRYIQNKSIVKHLDRPYFKYIGVDRYGIK